MTASFAYLTPYQFASNRPIDGIDLDGKEWSVKTKLVKGKDNKPKLVITLNVKVGFHHTEGLPENFIKMAEIFVEKMYKANYTTSDGTEVEIETTADFYQINDSKTHPIVVSYGEFHEKAGVTGETMDSNGGTNPTSQDAFIILFRKFKKLEDESDPKSKVLELNTSVWDLMSTLAHELGHTLRISTHDGQTGKIINGDELLTDENNLMNWLKPNNIKAHLEAFQIIRGLINIMNDTNYLENNNTNNSNDNNKRELKAVTSMF